jgi:hypothetical protein
MKAEGKIMKKTVKPILVVFLLSTILSTTPAVAQECIDYADFLRWQGAVSGYGYYPTCGFPGDDVSGYSDSAAVGSVVYATLSHCGLQVIDFTDPTAPLLVATIPIGGGAFNLALQGSVLYVISQNEYPVLLVYDVSVPLAPVYLGEVELAYQGMSGYPVRDLAVHGGYAYVSEFYRYDEYLEVIDVTNPSTPLSVTTLPMSSAGGLAATGDLLLMTAESSLEVLDITIPTAPAPLGSLALSNPGSVEVRGNYAYVSADGFRVIDLTDPAAPIVVGDIEGVRGGIALHDGGDLAFVVSGHDGFRIIDISDPTDPLLAASSITPLNAAATVSSAGAQMFVGEYTTMTWQRPNVGFHAYDISVPQSAPQLGSLETESGVYSIALNGDIGYAATSWGGIVSVDLSDLTDPVVLDTVLPDKFLQDLIVSNDLLLAVSEDYYDGDILEVFSLGDPATPAALGNVALPSWYTRGGIAVSEPYAFVNCDDAGLQVVDFSNPELPQIVGSALTTGNAQDITLYGQYALVMAGEFEVFDISVPASPTRVGSLAENWNVEDIATDGNYAYLATREYGLRVLDLTDPTNPVLAGSIELPGETWGIEIFGPTVYLAGTVGLIVCDVSVPTEPVYVGIGGNGMSAEAVTRIGHGLLLGGYNGVTSETMIVLPLQCPGASPVFDGPPVLNSGLLSVSPNPANPKTVVRFELDRAQRIDLTVYDMRGRMIQTIASGLYPVGKQQVVWHGIDSHGRSQASGVYHVRLSTADGQFTQKLTLVR